VIRESNRPDMALVCRATAADDADFTFAMNTAEVLLTTYLPPSPEPRADGPEWWHRAVDLERQDKLDEAEALLRKSIDHLGCYSLIAYLYELRVYDNSVEHDDAAAAKPALLLHVQRGRIKAPTPRQLRRTPEWAKPIVEAARQMGPRAVAT
jgi:hypothetical protein